MCEAFLIDAPVAISSSLRSLSSLQTLRITFEMRTSQDSMQVFIEPESASSSVDDAPSASTAENESSNISPSSTVETSPPPSDAASSQDQTSRPSKGPKRTIAQLDVNVDRYLDDALVKGPVDFGALPGREKDARRENELERRIRAGMPPVNCTCLSLFDLPLSLSELTRVSLSHPAPLPTIRDDRLLHLSPSGPLRIRDPFQPSPNPFPSSATKHASRAQRRRDQRTGGSDPRRVDRGGEKRVGQG